MDIQGKEAGASPMCPVPFRQWESAVTTFLKCFSPRKAIFSSLLWNVSSAACVTEALHEGEPERVQTYPNRFQTTHLQLQ